MLGRLEEYIGRSRQAGLKIIDRLAAPWRRTEATWNPFRHLVRAPALTDMERFLRLDDYWGAAETLRYHYAGHLPARFFAGAFDEAAPGYFAGSMREAGTRLLAQAERIQQGRFDLLGYEGLTFGDPVDWHLDPVARRRVPLIHWSRLDPFDVVLCGDTRLIWALNRHQWLVTLGEAYQCTTDARYAEGFEHTIRDWIRVNPVGLGINWVNSAEVASRLIAWCWAVMLFWPSSVLTADLLALILDELRVHAEHIERYLSYGGAPNWPLTVQALALLYIGLIFPELRRAERWRRVGRSILERQILKEVSVDGLCAEPSSHQRRLLEAYLHFIVLAERHAVPVPEDVRARVQALLNALLRLQRPDGLMLRVGEADGDWLLPFLPRELDDWRGLFAVAAVVFHNRHYAWAAGGEAPELLWLMGSDGVKAFGGLAPAPPNEAPSQECARGGYVQMRSGWERHSHQLLLDVGTVGSVPREQAASGDLLSIQCSAFGEPIVIDPHLSGAAGHREWQDFVRRGSARSTISIDGMPPTRRVRPLRHGAVLRQWCRNDRFELADASHDGYRSLAQPVWHRRRVLFVRRAYWVLIDDVQGSGRHRVDLMFHLASRSIELDSSLWAKIWTANGPGLAIKPFAGLSLEGEIKEGLMDTGGSRPPATALVYRCDVEVPIRLVTLLYPLRDRRAALPSVRPFADDRGGISGLMIDDPPATIFYSDHSVTVEAA